jgi:hypothetical protein
MAVYAAVIDGLLLLASAIIRFSPERMVGRPVNVLLNQQHATRCGELAAHNLPGRSLSTPPPQPLTALADQTARNPAAGVYESRE